MEHENMRWAWGRVGQLIIAVGGVTSFFFFILAVESAS